MELVTSQSKLTTEVLEDYRQLGQKVREGREGYWLFRERNRAGRRVVASLLL